MICAGPAPPSPDAGPARLPLAASPPRLHVRQRQCAERADEDHRQQLYRHRDRLTVEADTSEVFGSDGSGVGFPPFGGGSTATVTESSPGSSGVWSDEMVAVFRVGAAREIVSGSTVVRNETLPLVDRVAKVHVTVPSASVRHRPRRGRRSLPGSRR